MSSTQADDSIPEAQVANEIPPSPGSELNAAANNSGKLGVADRVSHFKNINETIHAKPAVTHAAPAVKFKVEAVVNRCPICQKAVYKVEEVKALGQVWHKGCFRCGGNNTEQLGCHRVMTIKENVETHGGHPYCAACATKLFKSGSAAEAITAANVEAEQADRKKALSGVKGLVSKRASHYVDISGMSEHEVSDVASKLPLSTKAGGGGSAADKFRDPNYAQSMVEKCVCCQKPVYKAEELRSFGALFHKSCFVCGGAEEGVGCKRGLANVTYEFNGNIAYCKACYQKNFMSAGRSAIAAKLKKRSPKKSHRLSRGVNENDTSAAADTTDNANDTSMISNADDGGDEEEYEDEEEEEEEEEQENAEPPEERDSNSSRQEAENNSADSSVIVEEEAPAISTVEEAEAKIVEQSQPQPEPEPEPEPLVEPPKEPEPEPEPETLPPPPQNANPTPSSVSEPITPARPPLITRSSEFVDNDADDDDDDDDNTGSKRSKANNQSSNSNVVVVDADGPQNVPTTPGGSLKPNCAPVLVSSNSNGFRVWRMTYESDFDENGILFFIGTQGLTKLYRNPHTAGFVIASMSSVYRGSVHNVCARNIENGPSYTENALNSWCKIDFGPRRFVLPTSYTVRHGGSSAGNVMRNWRLQGKVSDQDDWVTLRKHINDPGIEPHVNSSATFHVDIPEHLHGAYGFRYLRISQNEKNSSGNNCLFCCGLEFYGNLFEKI